MRLKALLVSVGLLLLAGCAKHTTRPEVLVSTFSLVGGPRSGSPATPVEFTARVKVLRPGVNISMGCDAGPISFILEDAAGHRVNTSDPCAVRPACPVGWGTLPQGSELEATFRFAGVVFPAATCPSTVATAASGRYTLRARFTYGLSPSPSVDPLVQERSVTFDWDSGLDQH